MSARDEVLRRIRVASRTAAAPPVERQYRTDGHDELSELQLMSLLTERLVDYGADVVTCSRHDVAASVQRLFEARGADRVLVPFGFPEQWLPRRLPVERDLPHLDADQLDAVPAVLTTCALAIAETGTVVLDGGDGMGRRALTLVPDVHVVLVRSSAVVRGVPEAIARLDPSRPLTWISGPSATSDIELDRVEGVHGPRQLAAVLID